MTSELPDDELVNLPTDNLRPGELVRAFQVRAEWAVKKLVAAQPDEISLMLVAERKEETKEAERDEMQRREDLLLAQLDKHEQELLAEAERLDARAIKLDDGRRVYVDHDKYRDAEGRELKDADRAQAEVHHLDHPDAATWQEHKDIERQKQATRELRQRVENLNASDSAGSEKALTAYEAEFQSRVAGRLKEGAKAADSADTDYMAAYGLTGNFKQAVTGPTAVPAGLAATPSAQPKTAALTF